MTTCDRSQACEAALVACQRRTALWLVAVLAFGASAPTLRAQLAITEVMSWASLNGACVTGTNADFWELTNFGTNDINLTGYTFCDRDKEWPKGVTTDPFDGRWIGPGESIIFLRPLSGTADEAAFRAWWGEFNLPSNLQIIFYPRGFGFDELGDAVQFGDDQTNLLDRADFGVARRRITFTYDTNCGTFGVQSELGMPGVFPAACTDDIGSPGVAPCGPVRLSITEQPASLEVDGGGTAAFFVQACGLPKPKMRWLFNGQALSNGGGISGASTSGVLAATLVIDKVEPAHAGEYSVELDNGLEQVTSAVATLTVSTVPTRPTILCLHGPLPYGEVTTNQTAVFEAVVRGYPPPALQWARVARSNGVDVWVQDIPGATNQTLILDNVDFSDAGTNRLVASNALGSATNYTELIVKRKPLLYVTEAMQEPCPESRVPVGNWWELTNLDTNAVNLRGYWWDDWPGNIGGGPKIAHQVIRRPGQCPQIRGNDVIVQPGESVVFVEGLTPEQFVDWWGPSNLPPRLQIIRYTANGLNADDDEINVWNATATEDEDRVCRVTFSTAVTGVTKWFLPTNQCFYSLYGVPSVEGQGGAYRADKGCDIGSPGWTVWTPAQLVSLTREGPGVQLVWRSPPGATNLVHHRSRVHEGPWTYLGTYWSAGATRTAFDPTGGMGSGPDRFYRILTLTPWTCPLGPLGSLTRSQP